MSRKLISLVLTLLLVFGLASSAMAVDTLNLLSMNTYEGYLSVVAATDYVNETDMNFAAQTENGALNIIHDVVLRNEGTSWFVIMEYGNYMDNASHQKTMDRALKKVAEMIADKDDGALVRCDEDHAISIEKSNILKENLVKQQNKTDAKELGSTIKAVMSYIQENKSSLMPNVAVVVLTACPASKVTDEVIDDIGATLTANNGVTTHIIVTAGKDVYKNDRAQGEKLIDKAKSTVGGTGYMTEKLVADEADKAIQRVSDAERRKIWMILDPVTAASLGHTLTVTQTTAGGKELKDTKDIPDALYTLWEQGLQERAPQSDEIDGTQVSQALREKSSSIPTIIVGNNTPVEMNSGMSTELLVGIIAGAVVLALLIALLVMRLSKNKKSSKASTQIYANSGSSAPSASSGTTITLTGDNGSVLKGQMKGGKLTVGRNGARAMLSVPSDGKLSGLHATFTKQGSQMLITDNGSTNGTKLNGNKIAAATPTAVHQNDTVTLGSTTYTVTWR